MNTDRKETIEGGGDDEDTKRTIIEDLPDFKRGVGKMDS